MLLDDSSFCAPASFCEHPGFSDHTFTAFAGDAAGPQSGEGDAALMEQIKSLQAKVKKLETENANLAKQIKTCEKSTISLEDWQSCVTKKVTEAKEKCFNGGKPPAKGVEQPDKTAAKAGSESDKTAGKTGSKSDNKEPKSDKTAGKTGHNPGNPPEKVKKSSFSQVFDLRNKECRFNETQFKQ
jgi:hypothetical protein